MNRLLLRVATGLSTAALVAYSFVGPALAVDVEISGNGAGSSNTSNVSVSNSTQVTQSNTANITNDVSVNASTGNNDANRNTGGDVSVDTGNASANVSVSNTANSNTADVNGCCAGETNVTISGNGADSTNEANVGVENIAWVSQDNTARVQNNVGVNLDTGNNDANRNTGGNVGVSTGDAQGDVAITNMVNKNVASVGSGANGGGSLAVVISGNGAESSNTANVGVGSLTGVEQINLANIINDVWVNGNTGNNDANRNTGGEVTIDTGNAKADIDVSNLANFNAADIDACGCILDASVKIKNNGADTENEANVTLASISFVGQDNLYACGRGHHGPRGLSGLSENNPGGQRPCNDVNVNLDSGNNDANRNTQGGEPEVITGDTIADVIVGTTANSNVVGDADVDVDFPELPDSNGSSVSLVLLWLLAQFS